MKLNKIAATFICAATALCMAFGGCAANCGGPSDDPMAPGQGTQETPGGDPSVPEVPGDVPGEDEWESGEPFYPGIYNTSKVGYEAEYLGTAERVLPAVSDGGLDRYPVYGTTMSGATTEEKNAIIAENNSLIAGSSTYDAMDADGNLYLKGAPTDKKLYKHTAAAGMYEGDVSDDEQAVIKRITYISRGTYGNLITGLYAPAGEVVKIEMSAADLAATGGITVYIGQVLADGKPNNIWAARDFNRMPVIANAMQATGEESYVGSYLGGPIYIVPKKDCGKFTVTISGAVSYPHYIHGYTTREEFERNKESTAPYFDLEVWDDSVRHSGPAARVSRFGYDRMAEAAVLWDKIARVSNQIPSGSRADTGIIFLYDPFVAAGAMVAFVGRNTVNCPLATFTSALDAQSAVEDAAGFWGVIHEFNHHYQRFGFAPGDEVTNNAVSLVEYSLFTRVSSLRTLGNANQGHYSGWNRYTNPAWVLSQTLATTGVNSALDGYANLLYAFGQQKFIEAAQLGGGRGGADVWFAAVSDATGYDMSYYFAEILNQSVSGDVLADYSSKNAPMYVPVATIYQTGAGYLSGGEVIYTRTAQPYAIRAGRDFELNLKNNVILPEGFSFTVKSLTAPARGRLVQREEGVYVYTPDDENSLSGEMYLTLGITAPGNAFKVEDVRLVIELEPTYANAPVTRTTYLYDNLPYDTASSAYMAGYAGYSSVTVGDNSNRVQNGNCEIWEPGYSDNAVMELSGKVLIPSDGRYRFALRGRYYAALYISLDGKNFSLAGELVDAPRTDGYFPDDPSTYTDVELKGGQYVWFREVLLVTDPGAYIGLGMGKFSGDEVTLSHVADGLNVGYSPRAPFVSDYFYNRSYTYNYTPTNSGKGTLVSAQYTPWEGYPVGNLFDGDDGNYIHSAKGSPVSADNPFDITVDLGSEYVADTFTIYGAAGRGYQPKSFVLWGGSSRDDMTVLATVENAVLTGNDVVVSFGERAVRYYRLVVTDTFDTSSNRYIAYRYATFGNSAEVEKVSPVEGGVQLSPDTLSYFGNWSLRSGLSTFGHAYVANGGSAAFTFSGTAFAVLCPAFSGRADVYIDGVFYASVSGSQLSRMPAYVSPVLPDGEHAVELRAEGEFIIDSIVVK